MSYKAEPTQPDANKPRSPEKRKVKDAEDRINVNQSVTLGQGRRLSAAESALRIP